MFSITVEEVVQICTRKGITLVGMTEGIIKPGDYLFETNNKDKLYKVIGIEMLHYINDEKNRTHNPAILIEQDNFDPIELKGKTLELF